MFLVINDWMKIICCYYHPILDVYWRQFLDEIYAIQYWMFLVINFGWKLYAAIIIQYWMIFVVSFWMKIMPFNIGCFLSSILDGNYTLLLSSNIG